MTYSIKELPKYTRGEEIANSSTHFLGALFSIFTMIFYIVFAVQHNKTFVYMIPYFIYSIFMFVMFFMSGFYHSRPFNSKQRAISRIIDHSDIYLFIAATYTPICAYSINNRIISISLLCFIWIGGVLGIVLNFINIDNKFIKLFTFILYIFLGGLIIIVYPLNVGIKYNVFMLILFGEIAYGVGSIIYQLGKKHKYFHSIFHVFILIGVVLQFVGIYLILVS